MTCRSRRAAPYRVVDACAEINFKNLQNMAGGFVTQPVHDSQHNYIVALRFNLMTSRVLNDHTDPICHVQRVVKRNAL